MSTFTIWRATIGLRAARPSVLWAPKISSVVSRRVSAKTYTAGLGSRAVFCYSPSPFARLSVLAAVAAVGVGTSSVCSKPIECQSPSVSPVQPPKTLPLPPASAVDVYGLSFGTVCGICAGVFVKKGAKLLAFLFGGVFVLLQYLNSLHIIRADWRQANSLFERAFYSEPVESSGSRNPPSFSSLWKRFINFLIADFQQRASFIAGFTLGLRVG